MNRQGAIKVWQNTISTWGKRILISALNCSAICTSSMDGFNSTDGTGKLKDLRWSNCGMIWWRNLSRLSPLLQPKFKYCKFGQSIGRSCQWNELATGMPKWEHWRLRWVSKACKLTYKEEEHRGSIWDVADRWNCWLLAQWVGEWVDDWHCRGHLAGGPGLLLNRLDLVERNFVAQIAKTLIWGNDVTEKKVVEHHTGKLPRWPRLSPKE